MIRRMSFLVALFSLLTGMVYAQQGLYTDSEYYAKGSTVRVFASVPTGTYVLKVYNLSVASQLVYTSPTFSASLQSVSSTAYATGCNWQQTTAFVIPTSWAQGLYAIEVTSGTLRYGARFVVTEPVRGSVSRVVLNISFNTQHAYNNFGGKSLYDYNSSDGVRSPRVSYNRPLPYRNDLDLFMLWEAKFLAWLQVQGIAVEFTTDRELHENPSLLNAYDVVITCGHDEYWSRNKRRQIEQFVSRGGKFICLSGNTCWWQVRFEGNVIVCYKSTADPLVGIQDSLVTVNWYASPVNYPENILHGVSFRNGGYVNSGAILPQSAGYGDFAAYDTQHWVYEGTGLHDGQEFGTGSGIVGYEADAALFAWDKGIPHPTGTDGTPANFRILGISPAQQATGSPVRTVTMGIMANANNGWVFNAATTGWAYGLASDPAVSRITLNVLQRFMTNAFPPAIVDWSPAWDQAATINNQSVFLNNTDVTISPGDSVLFRVRAERAQQYQVSLDGVVVGSDSVFGYRPSNATGHTLRITALNPYGSSSMAWEINRGTQPPLSTIVSDDFSSGVLNTSVWRFTNPRNDVTPGFDGVGAENARLRLTVPGGIEHDIWSTGFTAPRLMQQANNTNFEIEAKFDSPINDVFQEHGMLVAQQGYARTVRTTLVATTTNNTRLYVATFLGLTPTQQININVAAKNAAPMWLRVKRTGETWTVSYSTNGTIFTQAGVFTFPMIVDSVGVMAGNAAGAGTTPPAYNALIDYFFNTALPVVPEDGVAPVITSHPSDLTVSEGSPAIFSVSATGTPPLTYQWQRNNSNILGQTSASYTLQGTTLSDNGATFRCLVTNARGFATSNSATLTVTGSTPVTSGIISDDFSAGVLNTAVWTFTNPRNDVFLDFTGVGTQDARLRFIVPAGIEHDLWSTGFTAPRIMQRANNTDFEVETKFDSPLNTVYQMNGVLASQMNTARLLRATFVTNSTGTATRLYVASYEGLIPTQRMNLTVCPANVSPMWLRLRRRGNEWTVLYSTNGTAFTSAGSFVFVMTVDSVGVLAGNAANAGAAPPAYTALVDYFFNTASPIVPGDGSSPSITSPPSNQTVVAGAQATFSIAAAGTPPLSYRWQRNNADIPGATLASYTTPATTPQDSGSSFRCIVSNARGSVTSTSALLTILLPPTIATQPADQNIMAGQTATFIVAAQGSAPLHYQWQRDGIPIDGATLSTYKLNAVITDSGASFKCVVSNAAGSVTSSAAVLIVLPASVQAQNLLENPGFESGVSDWMFYTDGTGSWNAVAAVGCSGSKAARIQITTTGSNIQFFQSGIILQANTRYRLIFRGYSTTGHDVSVSLQKHTSPYTYYGLSNRVFNLTTGWTSQSFEFVTGGFTGTVNDGRLRFWFASYAAAGDVYFLDEITLTQVINAANHPVEDGAPEVTDLVPPRNFPNPFNPTTVISYSLPSRDGVSLKVYDILGREVATLVEGEQDAGPHTVAFGAAELSSGIYFYRLTVGERTFVRKVVLER